MQFRRKQRDQMAQNWNDKNWFWANLEPLYREIVAKAYGVQTSTPAERNYCQECTSQALAIFAQKIGSTKSKAVHAMQTYQQDQSPAWSSLAEAWQESFREIINGN